MSRKIATPTAVFNACDELEASGKPWNRDDVRLHVGGGGYNVIDPLIQAWRKLKPLKEVAPITPAEILYQLTESIEAHLSKFIDEAEQQKVERTDIFENTVGELSNRIEILEQEMVSLTGTNEQLRSDKEKLVERLDGRSQELKKKDGEIIKFQSENDELRGTVYRIEKQLTDSKQQYRVDQKNLESRYESKINALIGEHKKELIAHKKELIQQNEQSENRLMKLLDQERIDGKNQIEECTAKLESARQNEQALNDELSNSKAQLNQLESMLVLNKERFEDLNAKYMKLQKTQDTVDFEKLQSSIIALESKMKERKKT